MKTRAISLLFPIWAFGLCTACSGPLETNGGLEDEGASAQSLVASGVCASNVLTTPATPATASSVESSSFSAALAVDGNASTRWSSAFANDQWLMLDLGATRFINRVRLSWEAAYSGNYNVQVANSAAGPWTNIFATTSGNGGIDDLTGLSGQGRYVRLLCNTRATPYGNSVFEMSVFGDANPSCNTATCGNGVVEAGEQCDDGNLVSGDGCSSTCQTEAVTGCAALAGNMISNCDFSQGLAGWAAPDSNVFYSPAAGTQSVVGGVLQLAIVNGGTQTWQVQPRVEGLTLKQNQAYTVTFSARSDAARTLNVSLTQNADPYPSFSGDRQFALTTVMQTFSFTFTMAAATNNNVKLELKAGSSAADVFLDNVSVVPVTSAGSCTDNIKNGNETAVDCGGSCGACPPLGFNGRPSNTTCVAGAAPPSSFALQQIWTNLSPPFVKPIKFAQQPGSTANDFFVGEQTGTIIRVANSGANRSVFLNLANAIPNIPTVNTDQESGIASFAFHPSYPQVPYFYVSYVANPSGSVTTRTLKLVRFRTDNGGGSLNTSSAVVLVSIPKDGAIHHAGDLAFGPDGKLYMSVGDDGNNQQGDLHPQQAQNPATYYGKILRLKVGESDAVAAFSVPDDNPVWPGVSPKNLVWAKGFRNPWRISFDRGAAAGSAPELWVGNVGFSSFEEVNRVTSGGNYGWPGCEGTPCPSPNLLVPASSSTAAPYYSYANGGTAGPAAVIGGFVYRGAAMPALQGKYIFNDYQRARVWALDTQGTPNVQELFLGIGQIATWGQDNAGELYALSYKQNEAGDDTTKVYALRPGAGTGGQIPASLSGWGCFNLSTPGSPTPAAGVVPFDVAQKLWSDGADKDRYLALPNGAVLNVSNPEDFTLPSGAVTIKSFRHNGQIFETRLFVRHTDGSYGAYTYEWNAALTDATLVPPEGKSKTLSTGLFWSYPSRGTCFQCHTAAAGFSLGLETRQLNKDMLYPSGVSANQLRTLAHNGMLSTSNPDLSSPPLPSDLNDSSVPINERVSAYLHVNCASCHRGAASEAGRAGWNALYSVPFEDRGLCQVAPLMPLAAPQSVACEAEALVNPGNPELSNLFLRVNQRSGNFMPPVGTTVVHAAGVDLLSSWISGISTCPAKGTALPARVQAEAYNRFQDSTPTNDGGAGACSRADAQDLEATTDTGGGCNVGWTAPGEWLEFDVNVTTARGFNIVARIASGGQGTKSIYVEIDGVRVPGTLNVVGSNSAAGWQTWSSPLLPSGQLCPGNHRVRVIHQTGDVNLNWIEFQ